jgi:hypothetical protein
MEVLLTRNNINHFVEMVLVISLLRGANVPGQIQTRSVTLSNERFRKLVFFKINQHGALIFY